ncbi:hypothetical protein GEOBRER4_n2820 [Citrifermentans bremense]|uniref:Uncharacterized protein n=1 Tax=Citrifermentans bremense TaxID=60035 RepID=A0A6S6M0S9_9BACT|nr:hypothetical protein [Citrifermentans bremense]BCG47962.1 hypothetical protein GEOBRER4_n2820 [Citrifermentans bremense]
MSGELQQLLAFLLPRSPLDFLFFIILLGWMGYSLYAANQVVKRFPALIESSPLFKHIDTGNAHDLMLAARVPRWDNVVDNAPGFALVLGLLGTFLGIGLAINHAGQILGQLSQAGTEAADITKSIANLKPMLMEIGLKFKSSAWGIMTHIALRVLIPRYFEIDRKRAEAVLKELQDDANRNKEDARTVMQLEQEARERQFRETAITNQLLKSLVVAAQRNEEQSSIQNRNIITAITNLREGAEEVAMRSHQETLLELRTLGENLVDLLECSRNTEESLKVIKNFGKQVDKLGGSVNIFADKITEFKEETRQVLEDMDESLKSSIQGVDTTVNAMSTRIDAVLKSFSKNMSDTIDNLKINMNSSTERLNGTVVEMKDSMTKTILSFNDKVTETLDAAGEKISESSRSIEKQVNLLSDQLGLALKKVFDALETTNKVTIEMEKHYEQMALVFKSYEKSNDRMMDQIIEMTSNSARYSTEIADMSENLAVTFGAGGEIAIKLDQLVREHQGDMNQLQQITAAIDGVRTTMPVTNQAIVQKLEGLLDASHGIKAVSLDALQSLLKIHENMQRTASA